MKACIDAKLATVTLAKRRVWTLDTVYTEGYAEGAGVQVLRVAS